MSFNRSVPGQQTNRKVDLRTAIAFCKFANQYLPDPGEGPSNRPTSDTLSSTLCTRECITLIFTSITIISPLLSRKLFLRVSNVVQSSK